MSYHGPYDFSGSASGDKPKGTNRALSQIFTDSCRFLAFPRKLLQVFAGTCRKLQIGVCPLRFVPLSAALIFLENFAKVLRTGEFLAHKKEIQGGLGTGTRISLP